MENLLNTLIKKKDHKDFKAFIAFSADQPRRLLLRNDIIQLYRGYCDRERKNKQFREHSSIFNFIKKGQELIVDDGYLALLHRHAIARYDFYRIRHDGEVIEQIPLSSYLDLKDRFAGGTNAAPLQIDFMPFYDFSPSIRDVRSVGNGIRFLNRFMSSNFFSRPEQWNAKLFEFLKLHQYNGRQLLINGGLASGPEDLFSGLEKTIRWLKTKKPATPYVSVKAGMKRNGFEVGWGNTVDRIIDTMQTLLDLLSEPTGDLLERFISRVPMPLISKVAIISPHGWFGQTNAFGKPDTGGQVIYILDQVRSLEKLLIERIKTYGLDVKPKIIVLTRLIPEAENTTCDQKLEKIFETENAWILRVPFRDNRFNILKKWVSRFKIWPYLETFAKDAAPELKGMLNGRPDLVIGNYSDGNLVASLLSDEFDVIQCTIAHALEKTKYSLSDLKWRELEKDYHFNIQFTADLYAMNKSDFIITSTLQEIIGTEDTIGQYESYQFFSMPSLYQVISGTNLFAPKFNVIPPGVDEGIYFPYYQKERRIAAKTRFWENRLFCDDAADTYGALSESDKMPIFTMARFDKIKNITGLIEAFGSSKTLRQNSNLIFAAGVTDPDQSNDTEEQNEIRKAHRLIRQYDLDGGLRWLPSIDKLETGEVYRVIADRGGIFVQPALFEAFGLTIIEAMASGLPTFAPKFGGPLEIIEYGVSGFLLNTSRPDLIAGSLEKFIEQCRRDQTYWKTISENAVKRVHERFNWNHYSRRLLNLTKLYGFWRFAVSEKGMKELDRYCDMLYHFLIRKCADSCLEKH